MVGKSMGISVLMSVYKKEIPAYFEAALNSVLSQTKLPDEIVVVKDGPLTIELEDVLTRVELRYPSLVVYQFDENVQLGRALAKGVELCQHELVARMDTDDIACPDRLAVQYEYMINHPEVEVCGGFIEEFNDAGTYKKIKEMPTGAEPLLKYAKYRNPLNHMTVMFRKNVILEVGNYQHYPFLEDYYLWCRVIAKGKTIANIPKVLVQMRTNEGVYDRRGGWEYFKQYHQLRKEQKKMGLLSGLEYLIAVGVTMVMTLQPAELRKIIYQRVLRR